MIGRLLIAVAARWVPEPAREAWTEEWLGELHALAHRHPAGLGRHLRAARFAAGAFPHARHLRRRGSHPPSHSRDAIMDNVLQDIRHAVRTAARAPLFVGVVLATLALGIGATTAIFSVVDGVLLRPLPYPEADRLVMVGSSSQRFPGLAPVNPMDFFAWRERNSTFSQITAVDGYTFDLIDEGEPTRVEGTAVTAEFFDLVGIPPLLGRAFRPEDDTPNGERVVVISYGLWQGRYGGDPDIVGRRMRTVDHGYTIVGVMPAHFRPPEAFWTADAALWMPLSFIDNPLTSRGARFLQVIGRLRTDVTLYDARQDLNGISRALAEQFVENRDRNALVEPLRAETIGDVGQSLGMLMGAVSLLLLIACVNVANLFLARGIDRGREMALRSALGAGGRRIYQQVLTEGIVLALLGGGLGVGLATVAVRAFRIANPGEVPRAAEVGLDGRVLAFALVVSVATGLIFAMVPAWRVSHADAGTALRAGGQRPHHGGGLRRALVAGELGLAMMLVVGAGLFLNSFARLQSVDPGFDPTESVTMRLTLTAGYDTPEKRVAFLTELTRRIDALPTVRAATYASTVPFGGDRYLTGVRFEGRETDPANPSVAEYVRVDAGYFRTLGIDVVDGRAFTPVDDAAHDPVVMVNEAFARRYWPGEQPLGQRLGVGRNTSNWLTVVGVANDVKGNGLDQPVEPEMYFPAAQRPASAVQVVARTPEAAPTIAAIRGIVSEMDDRMPVSFGSLEELVARSVILPRFYTILLAGFAAVALTLAAVGVYGTMSYLIGQRRREMGIRLALGASGPRIVHMVMRQGVGLTLVGVALGLGGAVATSRLMEGFLFGVSARDAITYAAGTVGLGIVALAACYLPARRAGRADPMAALRTE